MKQLMLSSLLLLWCSWQCIATNYYFSTAQGDDARSPLLAQNPQTPWRTTTKLNAFFAQLQSGDSILFNRGEVFFGTIQTSKSGSTLSPIVLGAYGQGEKPVISGFTTISSWKSIGGGIYESPVLANQSVVNLVVINGINQAKGRYPNASAGNKGYLNFESHGSNFIVDNQLSTSINWANAELVLRSTRYTIDKVKITSHSKKRLNFSAAIPNGLMDGYGYFVQNHLKTLDKFGEWFYNPSTKKLNVYFGSNNAANFKVEVGTIDVLIEPRASNLVIDNLTIRGANRYGVFCDWSNLQNLKITNSQILYSGVDAIQLSGRSNFVLENCSINYSNSKAVNLNYNNPYAVVKNNTIRNSGIYPGMMLGQSYGIVSYTKGLLAQNNTIVNTGYAGIRFFGDSNLIKNNFIDTFCTVLDDGAGIYTWTGVNNNPFFKRSIIGNIILNGLAAPEGTNEPNYLPAEGIYLDDNATNVEVFGNTVANCRNNGIFIHNSRSIQIQNNVLFNNGAQFTTVHDYLAGPVLDLTVTDNLFFSKKPEQVNAYFKSLNNDFSSLGNFSGNYYARPFDDNLTIISEYDDNKGNRKKQLYDVKSPQLVAGKNQEAGGSPVKISPYTVLSVNENLNKYPNGEFKSSPPGFYCWSAEGDCRTTWTTTSALNDKAMKISGVKSGLITLECGSVVKSKQYLLRFSAIGEVETHVEVFLRQIGSPWKTLSTTKTIRITPTRSEYEVLFSFPASENAACIVFQAVSENFSYWLDNVKLLETNISMTNPDDHIRFEYNPTLADKTIQLEATYFDVEKTAYSGTLVLKPFESVVLLKDPQHVSSYPSTAGININNNFRAQVDGCKIVLSWGWLIDENFSHFELERSTDGNTFELLSAFDEGADPGFQFFKHIDNPLLVNNYYRLKTVNLDGKFTYSELLKEQTLCDSDTWLIYPTVLHKGQSTLTIKIYTEKPTVTFTVVDQLGRVIHTMLAETVPGWNKINWNLPAEVAAGSYYLLRSDSQQKEVLTFMVLNSSF